jgi:hypothetical protein
MNTLGAIKHIVKRDALLSPRLSLPGASPQSLQSRQYALVYSLFWAPIEPYVANVPLSGLPLIN